MPGVCLSDMHDAYNEPGGGIMGEFQWECQYEDKEKEEGKKWL